eukprot:5246735-Prymnesium_polylepis.1
MMVSGATTTPSGPVVPSKRRRVPVTESTSCKERWPPTLPEAATVAESLVEDLGATEAAAVVGEGKALQVAEAVEPAATVARA